MRKTKKILSILLTCLMLTSLLSVGVVAAGTQDNPIDAATKWFGYGVDTYLLNPTIAEGSDGIWYTLTAETAGVLSLEHSYKNVDYTITITHNDVVYEGGCVDGEPYNRPIVTAPIQIGDTVTVHIATKDAAAGTVYASMNVIAADADNPIKAKSNGLTITVGAGETLYFQDDSLNAIYATMGLLIEGNVADTTFYTVSKNSESGSVAKKAVTDSDADGIIEAKLGGSLGGAGAPAVKPAWAIENASNENRTYTLTIVSTAHECNWDDDNDNDCNTCGAVRDLFSNCEHEYDDNCDAYCNLCDTERQAPHYTVGDYDCDRVCCVCGADLSTAEHQYDFELDNDCSVCGAIREIDYLLAFNGWSVSEDVNGLACRFDMMVEGIATSGTVAIYKDATIHGYKLVSMGALVCNNFSETNVKPTHKDADGLHVVDIPAKYLCNVDKETGEISFAIRLINIPEGQEDTEILFVPYVILEDAEGHQHTQYIDQWCAVSSYNQALEG